MRAESGIGGFVEGEEIPIRGLDVSGPASLRLRGTILTYLLKERTCRLRVEIPVELIEITEARKFDGKYLISTFFSLLVAWVVGVGLVFSHGKWIPEVMPDAVIWCFLLCQLCGFGFFLVYLIRFFFRAKVVTLHMAADWKEIRFWAGGRRRKKLSALLEEILKRQASLRQTEESGAAMRSHASAITSVQWNAGWVTASWIFLCCIPGLLLEESSLLLLGLIPLAGYFIVMMRDRKEPAEFLRARKLAWEGNHARARDVLLELIRDMPDYLPAQLLAFEQMLELEDFHAAEEMLGRMTGGPQLIGQCARNLAQCSYISDRKRAGTGMVA